MKFPSLVGRTMPFPEFWSMFILIFSGQIFPQSQVFFSTCLYCSVFSWIIKRHRGRLVFYFCAALQYSVLWTPAALFSPDLWLCCFYSETLPNLGSSCSHSILETLMSVNSNNFSLHLFPSIRDHYSPLPVVWWFENYCFTCWFLFVLCWVCLFFFSGRVAKSSHCYPILWEVEVLI